MSRPPNRAQITEALAAALAEGGQVTDAYRSRAAALLDAAGVGEVLETLEMAERILRTGEGFHSVERFFVDGSPEQRYLQEMFRAAAER